MHLEMTKEEILALSMEDRIAFGKLQTSQWKRTAIQYDAFVELPAQLQIEILTEFQSGLEWIRGTHLTFDELLEKIKQENCGFHVVRGDSGINKDVVMFSWNVVYYDTFPSARFDDEWLKKNGL